MLHGKATFSIKQLFIHDIKFTYHANSLNQTHKVCLPSTLKSMLLYIYTYHAKLPLSPVAVFIS